MVTVDWDDARDVFVITFAYNPRVVSAVRSIPGARYESRGKRWFIPLQSATPLIAAVRGFGVRTTARSEGLLSDVDLADEGSPGDRALEPAADGFTISRLNAAASDAIAAAFGGRVWVIGECSGVGRGRSQGHLYFQLVERDRGENVCAAVTAVLFSTARDRVARTLAKHALELEDGLMVRMQGRVDLYRERGAFQLVVDDIDPAYSAGDLTRRRDEVIRLMHEAGLATRQLEIPMPTIPRRIALLTSNESDAFHDVLSTLRESGHRFEVTVFDVRVQGAELEPTVLRALDAVQSHAPAFDICLIARGGGGRAELGAWDNFAIARRVALLDVKVVVAIGHEMDSGALDAVAASYKTPSAAAKSLVDALDAALRQLTSVETQLDAYVARRTALAAERLAACTERIARGCTQRVATQRSELSRMPTELRRAVDRRFAVAQTALAEGTTRLGHDRIKARFAAEGEHLARTRVRARREADLRLAEHRHALDSAVRATSIVAPARLAAAAGALEQAAVRVRLAHPSRLFARGLARVTDAKGASISRIAQVRAADVVSIRLIDGVVEARALTIVPDPAPRPEQGVAGRLVGAAHEPSGRPSNEPQTDEGGSE